VTGSDRMACPKVQGGWEFIPNRTHASTFQSSVETYCWSFSTSIYISIRKTSFLSVLKIVHGYRKARASSTTDGGKGNLAGLVKWLRYLWSCWMLMQSIKLQEAFKPTILDIVNESHLHAHHEAMQGNTNRETHFR
jgi:hypothetical protein